jgi:OMF family outer membrane factor
MKRIELRSVLALAGLAVAGGRNLTLDEALRISADRDPQTRVDSLSTETATLQESAQKATWLPSVGLQAAYNRLSNIDEPGVTLPFPTGPVTVNLAPQIPNQWTFAARADQMLWDGGRSLHLARSADQDAEAGRSARVRSKRDLVLKVATAYWNLSAAQSALDASARALDRADSQAVFTAASFREGTALEQDTLQARLRTRQIELSVEQAKASREYARQALCVAMGVDMGQDLTTGDPLRPVAPISGAAAERPEVVQARAQTASAQEQAAASRSGFQPQIVASAEYDYVDPNQRVIPNRDQFDGSWRVGISANWNLYRGGADDLTARRADLLARQSRLREVAAADAAKQDLARRQTEYALAKRRREISEASLPLARRDLDLARIRAQVGTALRLEAIDRASALAQAESDVAQAVATENVAALQLSIARGEDPSLSIARGEDPSWK